MSLNLNRVCTVLCTQCLLWVSVLIPYTFAGIQEQDAEAVASRFLHVYPQAEMGVETTAEGDFLVVEGERLLFRPVAGCPSPDPQAVQDQPLCASLAQPYPQGEAGRTPAVGFDPGRVRNEALLKHLYGSSSVAVKKNCVPVLFMGQNVQFNARHGAAAALARVGIKLERLVQQDPSLRSYLLPVAGTMHWRTVQGTNRLSAHSFGISIDLNVAKGPYWRWAKQTDKAVRDARILYPQAVVNAFEEEGFIWGGKWYSFDFMHFEYRPELLQ